MKTERRHELHTNDLAGWLGSRASMLRPYSKVILGGLLIGAVLLFGAYLLRGQREGRAVAGWTEYFEAMGIGDPSQRIQVLRKVARRYSASEASAWAWQSIGELDLAFGSMEMTRDRAEARERLENARDAFQEALRITRHDMLGQRARMGLAQTLEAMDEFVEAGQLYEQIIAKWPGSALANQSEDRLQFLRDAETRQFYDWFVAQKPRPPVSASPLDDSDGIDLTPLAPPESAAEPKPEADDAADFPGASPDDLLVPTREDPVVPPQGPSDSEAESDDVPEPDSP